MPYTLFDYSKHASIFPEEAPQLKDGVFFVDEETNTLVGYKPLGDYAEVSLNRSGKPKWLPKEFWDNFYKTAIALGFSQLVAERGNAKMPALFRRQGWWQYAPDMWYINLSDKV